MNLSGAALVTSRLAHPTLLRLVQNGTVQHNLREKNVPAAPNKAVLCLYLPQLRR